METAACVAFRTYHDAIHGIIRIPTVLCTHFVDTPAFRRLSRIHQLGNAHMVFPSATHTRFAHSLGVCWLAGEYFEAVHRNSGRPVAPEELMMVQLAGLMHDVGHGCFSHTLDRIASRWDIHWCHEHMSVAILQVLLLLLLLCNLSLVVGYDVLLFFFCCSEISLGAFRREGNGGVWCTHSHGV